MQAYHRLYLVFIPKYRRQVLFVALRKELGALFRELARKGICALIMST
jgi:REP element-mobilizing transposase RayT